MACKRPRNRQSKTEASQALLAELRSIIFSCSVRMKIKKLPNVLALHLKRFKYQESLGRFVKLAYRVVFPMQLRLFNTSDDVTNPDRLYELYAVVVHIGM